MEIKTDINTFKSDDISFVSFLLTQDIELLDISEDSPHHFVFHLSEPARCIELKRMYLNNAPAPARELFSQREMLITEIKKSGNRFYK